MQHQNKTRFQMPAERAKPTCTPGTVVAQVVSHPDGMDTLWKVFGCDRLLFLE
jgi:hypothetical protein